MLIKYKQTNYGLISISTPINFPEQVIGGTYLYKSNKVAEWKHTDNNKSVVYSMFELNILME